MSEVNREYEPARITPIKSISGLWLIPLITLLIGGWMVYGNWASLGQLITIEFPTAAGLEAGQTRIKTRDVEIGRVEDITLSDTLESVIVTARMDKEFEDLLVEGSRFWVVQPTVTLAGVSGLNTLLTGQYIQFSPGESDQPATDFIGLEEPPVTTIGTPGLHVRLTTNQDFSFSKGDQVHYQGIDVGKVEDVEFNFSDYQIYYSVFIEAPYHQLVTSNTRFWKASGINARLTGNGFEVETGSLETLISGGISFGTPEGQTPGQEVSEQEMFYVYSSRSAINERQYLFGIRYWVMVGGGVGGLQVGSPVTYRGVEIGRVLRTDYIPEGQTLLNKDMEIPIMIEINPGRLGLPDSEESQERAATDINNWISQGLNATIRSQNFLLGTQLVELRYDESVASQELSYFQDMVVIPTGVDTLAKFTDSIELFIDRMNDVPIGELMSKLEALLQQGNDTLASVNEFTSAGTDFLSNDRNSQLIEQMTDTMSAVEELAGSFSGDSQTNQQILNLLQSLSSLVEEFKPLVTELKNKPNGLIFPSSPVEEIVPTRKNK